MNACAETIVLQAFSPNKQNGRDFGASIVIMITDMIMMM